MNFTDESSASRGSITDTVGLPNAPPSSMSCKMGTRVLALLALHAVAGMSSSAQVSSSRAAGLQSASW